MLLTYSENLLLLEPVSILVEEIVPWARNCAAVYRYFYYLHRGRTGQALRERHFFDGPEDTPTRPLRANWIQFDAKYVEWLEPIDGQTKEDLQYCIEEDRNCIPVTRRS